MTQVDITPEQSRSAKISKSQRERYEREAQERHRLRSELHRFALWISPSWDEDNEDDVDAALRRVDEFMADSARLSAAEEEK